MKGKIADRARLFHILDAIYEIESYVGNASYDDFINHSMMRSATVKQLEVLAVAVGKVSVELQTNYPDVPWRLLSSFNKILVHEYFGINYEIVWVTAKTDVHNLKEKFEAILEKYLDDNKDILP